MTQSVRQRNLFAAEDFRLQYLALSNINLRSYDFDTIRKDLVQYIQRNFPENFNDFTASSEFIALLEVLSFLYGSLNFRVDLSAREAILDLAERRENIIKIADFLGYTPTRHLPARGLLKLVGVRTTQDVFNINGENLRGSNVRFEDNFQNFLLIMNEIFQKSNQFGRPSDSIRIGNTNHDIYATNITLPDRDIVFKFSGEVNSTRRPFEVHGIYIDDKTKTLKESIPNPFASFDMAYLNDGQGISSRGTGFFVGFKQGQLQFTDVSLDDGIPDMLIDLGSPNVNNSDIWVQEILPGTGEIKKNWTKVDTVFGNNPIFNTLSQSNRTLYSVKTLDNDSVNILFGDGTFSEIPHNTTLRTWFRTGLNQSYSLSPDDIGSINFTFDYNGIDGNVYKATFEAELQQPVNNAAPRETVSSIRLNAGRVFASQDRVISGDDYSVFPLTVSENVKKIKAINRTFAGHSRFIRPQDPTGQYQTVSHVAEDGYIYAETVLSRSTVSSTTLTAEQIFERYIENLIKHPEVINQFYDNNEHIDVPFETSTENFEWQQVTSGYRSSSGFLTRGEPAEILRVGRTAPDSYLNMIRPGSLVEFIESPYEDESNRLWAYVSEIELDGLGLIDSSNNSSGLTGKGQGTIVLSRVIPNAARVTRIFPSYHMSFTQAVRDNIVNNYLANPGQTSFELRFDILEGWTVVASSTDINAWEASDNEIRCTYSSNIWTILSKRLRYVFGSEDAIHFYNQNGQPKFNVDTGKPERDRIIISRINGHPDDTGVALDNNVHFYAHRYYTETDGYTDDRKIIVTLASGGNEHYPTDPLAFKNLIGTNKIRLGTIIEDGFQYLVPQSNGNQQKDGRKDMIFTWRHISESNYRIDPSISNLIDVFVLNQNYDRTYRQWVLNDRNPATRPFPPTEIELERQFANINPKKAVSDTIIYRPVEYKIIFGELADTELQGKFRVVKIPGITYTDNEIKTRIVNLINEFFHIDNWEFGDPFFFTELSSYVHQKMSGIVGSIIIVPTQNVGVDNLFQITPESNQLFLPDVTLNDIELVDNL